MAEPKKKLKLARLLQFIFLVTAIAFVYFSITGWAQDFPDVCQQSENILRNCTFDGGLDQWQTFTEAGAANFTVLQGGGECHAPLCPAAYIVTQDHFIGGLYQQVPVIKGNNYYANIVWLVFDSLVNDASIHQATGGIGRRIGLDPFGGTDPRSPNVVWSTDNWRNDCKICNIEHVTVTAQADTITLFLRIDDTWKLRAAEKGYPIPPSKDQFWIDDIGLKQVGGEAVVVQAPTDTPPPPTDTPPPPPPPTNTPEPQPSPDTPTSLPASDTPAPQPESTEEIEPAGLVAEAVSPVETPAALVSISTPASPPTLTPTTVPSPTPTFTRRPPRTPQPALAAPQRLRATSAEPASFRLPLMMGAVGATACIGGLALFIVGGVMAGLVWLYRLGWGQLDDEDIDEDDEYIEADDDHDDNV
jgi:hypothetical protein